MTYIIAEVGGNHDGNFAKALDHVYAAKDMGADAVKFQIYEAEKLVSRGTPAFSQAKGYKFQLDRFKDLEFSEDEWFRIIEICKKENIDFLATCFDLDSLEKYEPHMEYIKIASGDLTYKDLVEKAGTYNKQVILSTGGSSFRELQMASQWVPDHLLTVLHCVSLYPCPDYMVDLGRILELKQFYKRVGYSDHAKGITACLGAASLGAKVIEKHFSITPELDFGDHPHSASPEELNELVNHVQRINTMFSHNEYKIDPRFRRGGYAARDIRAGEIISAADIASLRPATLLHPHEYVGKTLQKDLKQGESLDG